jgi:predicted Zn-dependent peptidase
VLEEIAMYEDDPQDRVFDALGEAVFGAHPLGRAVIGRAEVVASVTREQLRAFHAAHYTPGEVVIAAAGSVDHDALVEMARAAEAGHRETSAPAPGPPAAPDLRAAEAEGDASNGAGRGTVGAGGGEQGGLAEPTFERRVRFLRKDTEQYHLCLGGRGMAREDERRFALRVLDNILGGGASSRLFQEVRERRGLAYSVFSFSNLYAHAGEVGLYVGTRPENLSEAVAVLAAELERFVREPADIQELERSRENAKGRMVLAMESTAARMNRLGSSVLCDLPILSVEEVIARIDAVTIDDLRELADELFRGPELSVAAIGPDEQALRAALAPLEAVAA